MRCPENCSSLAPSPLLFILADNNGIARNLTVIESSERILVRVIYMFTFLWSVSEVNICCSFSGDEKVAVKSIDIGRDESHTWS